MRVLGSQVQEGRRHWSTNGGGQTDEQGEYRAGNLVPGKYYVSVGPSFRPVGHVGDGAQGSDVGYPRVFYPNAAELEGAAHGGGESGKAGATGARPKHCAAVPNFGRSRGRNAWTAMLSAVERQLWRGHVPIGVRANPVTGVFRSGEIPAGIYTLVANCFVDGEISSAGQDAAARGLEYYERDLIRGTNGLDSRGLPNERERRGRQ